MEQVIPRPKRRLGCVAVMLLGLGIPLFVVLGTAGGLVCYGLAWAFGTPTVGVSIAAGIVALIIVCLSTPCGFGLGMMFLPSNEHPLLESVATVVGVVLGPIVCYQEVLFIGVPAAISAGLMFHFCQPLLASVLVAILAPLAGLGIGFLLVHAGGDSSSGGDGGWGGGDGDGGGD